MKIPRGPAPDRVVGPVVERTVKIPLPVVFRAGAHPFVTPMGESRTTFFTRPRS